MGSGRCVSKDRTNARYRARVRLGSRGRASDRRLLPSDVDIIFASGPPFASFRVASNWGVGSHGHMCSSTGICGVTIRTQRLVGNATIREEHSLLQRASSVVVISAGLKQSLQVRFGTDSHVRVVTNGYDPAELESVEPYRFGHFAIVYAGVFYPPKRVVDPVMAAVARLKAGLAPVGVEWGFHYFGIHGDQFRDAAHRFGVLDKAIIHGSVTRRDALSAIRGAGLAVVITSVFDDATMEDRGIVTGKVFDAIGLGTPLLAIAPPGKRLGRRAGHSGTGSAFLWCRH